MGPRNPISTQKVIIDQDLVQKPNIAPTNNDGSGCISVDRN